MKLLALLAALPMALVGAFVFTLALTIGVIIELTGLVLQPRQPKPKPVPVRQPQRCDQWNAWSQRLSLEHQQERWN